MEPNRNSSRELLHKYIKSDSLRKHSEMVASAMEAYARELKKSDHEIEKWWEAGLLHDLDWEKYPEDHPNKALNEILPSFGYDEVSCNSRTCP